MGVTRYLTYVVLIASLAAACKSSTSNPSDSGAKPVDGRVADATGSGDAPAVDATAIDGAPAVDATAIDGAPAADATVAVDAAAADAAAADAAAVDAAAVDAAVDASVPCSLVGTWTGVVPAGPFVGNTATFVIAAAGTYTGALPGYTWGGGWALTGSAFTINDTTGTLACPTAQVGAYNVTFAPSCNTADFAVTTDPCAGRMVVIDKIHIVRS